MCQNVFYTYSCGHMECVTYCCLKWKGAHESVCIYRQEPQYTPLRDQVCHDCNEMGKKRRQAARARRERYLQEEEETRLQTEVEARGYISEPRVSLHEQQSFESQHQHPESQQTRRAQQALQSQTRREPESSSPDVKTIRPLESNKLGNMQFHSEADALGLPPHGLYQFYTGQ
ncbi:hypothetical protein CGRA01v4_08050 [Colletotrichum graminicola]|uniref:Uncharacterized protein n=1 Tax=Colletotrichum graminicola (strain M1.001 / M2 / FGSC 10212) TaxID=645133 RepID=E3Q816_COLGM|nr:uncharacterized protein GLRG_02199 [Colletotrichum graminicola M1.001]EFQ27028.1 hypothetical protein GLRG_02199 [Colletotrichum graminicola M1.001]WDK16767.1 hypothetical protein CGRA01v4_08050 [Colletotrichum graminicola]